MSANMIPGSLSQFHLPGLEEPISEDLAFEPIIS